MKKEIYQKLFNFVPMRNVYVPLLEHYGRAESVSMGDQIVAKHMIELLYDISEKDSDHCRMDNPLMDVPFLIKVFVNNYKRPRVREEIMNNPNFDTACLLVMLAYAEKYPERFFTHFWDVGYVLISNALMPTDKLRRYAESMDKDMRKAVAYNPSCPEDIFEMLSEDRLIEVILVVARNPKTPIHILEKLARHNNSQVKKMVAFNPSASEEALRILAESATQYELILAIVTNRHCPANVLEYFASYVHHRKDIEKTFMVRLRVATNPNLSEHAWNILWNDTNPMYKNVALASKICPLEKMRELDWKAQDASRVVSQILTRDDLPEDLIMDFLTNYGARIRAVVIDQYDLSQEILVKFCKDKSKKVRYEVARRLKDNDALLSLLNVLDSDEYDTRQYVMGNLSFGAADKIIKALKENPESSYWKQVALSFVGNDKVSEEEMWKIFYAVKHLDYYGHNCLLADEMLIRMAKYRKTLSEESLEQCINIVLESGWVTNKSGVLNEFVYCKTLYTRELLNICCNEVASEASKKLK